MSLLSFFLSALHTHPATFKYPKVVFSHHRPGLNVRKPVAHLIVRAHGIVDGAKATTDTTARLLSEEDVEIFVLIDRVQAFAHPLTT